jgi:hypothetical protein
VLPNGSIPMASAGTGQKVQPGQLQPLLRSLGTEAICRDGTRPLLSCGWSMFPKSALRLPPPASTSGSAAGVDPRAKSAASAARTAWATERE